MTKDFLVEKYLVKKLSMAEIAVMSGCSIHKVQYWMNRHDIKRRGLSDAVYIKHNPSGDPFIIKNTLTTQELYLKGLGLGIYWGEGNKKNKHSVRVGNTDPELIKTFVSFLEVICQVKDSRILYSLQLFSDVDEVEALKFWMKTLNIPRTKIMPTVNRIVSGKIGTYKTKNQYGVLTVYVNNTKLRSWIVGQLGVPT